MRESSPNCFCWPRPGPPRSARPLVRPGVGSRRCPAGARSGHRPGHLQEGLGTLLPGAVSCAPVDESRDCPGRALAGVTPRGDADQRAGEAVVGAGRQKPGSRLSALPSRRVCGDATAQGRAEPPKSVSHLRLYLLRTLTKELLVPFHRCAKGGPALSGLVAHSLGRPACEAGGVFAFDSRALLSPFPFAGFCAVSRAEALLLGRTGSCLLRAPCSGAHPGTWLMSSPLAWQQCLQ